MNIKHLRAKTCTRCGLIKPVSEFETSNRIASGHTSRCKVCTRAYANKLYSKYKSVKIIEPVIEKACTKCGVVKSISEFYAYKNRPGKHKAACKLCDNLEGAARRKNLPPKEPTIKQPKETSKEPKKCTKCGKIKALSEFGRNSRTTSGITARCKICITATSIAYNKSNPEKVKIYAAKSRASRKEADKEYRKNNKERFSANRAKRRSAKLLAAVAWSNKEAILAIYEEAARLYAETNIPHHVDHIIPLVHPLVCGLHCEANLQILTASENCSKGNKFIPQ